MNRHRTVKLDANHGPIVDALRRVGAEVNELARFGANPDLLVLFRKRLYLLEVKTDDGSLEDSQRAMIAAGWPIVVVRSQQDALRAIGAM